jgi:hypothetical protein
MELKWPGEKLVEKMWETLAEKGVGGLLKPWQTIREGNAQIEVRRHEMLALAQAEADAFEIKAGRKRLLQDGTILAVGANDVKNMLLLSNADGRVEPTFDMSQLMLNATAASVADQVRSEVNVARAVILAEEILGQDTQDPPDAVVEDDWLSTWREYVGRVSSEELQRLWANILAGEVKAPGTYSARTLEFLRTLSKSEAEKIAKIAPYVIDNSFIARDFDAALEKNGIRFSTLLEMQELGILTGVDTIGLSITFTSNLPNIFQKGLICHNKILIVQRVGNVTLQLAAYSLTTLGKEIMRLGNFFPNSEYLTEVGKKVASQGFMVQIADITSFEKDGRINYMNAAALTS